MGCTGSKLQHINNQNGTKRVNNDYNGIQMVSKNYNHSLRENNTSEKTVTRDSKEQEAVQTTDEASGISVKEITDEIIFKDETKGAATREQFSETTDGDTAEQKEESESSVQDVVSRELNIVEQSGVEQNEVEQSGVEQSEVEQTEVGQSEVEQTEVEAEEEILKVDIEENNEDEQKTITLEYNMESVSVDEVQNNDELQPEGLQLTYDDIQHLNDSLQPADDTSGS